MHCGRDVKRIDKLQSLASNQHGGSVKDITVMPNNGEEVFLREEPLETGGKCRIVLSVGSDHDFRQSSIARGAEYLSSDAGLKELGHHFEIGVVFVQEIDENVGVDIDTLPRESGNRGGHLSHESFMLRRVWSTSSGVFPQRP